MPKEFGSHQTAHRRYQEWVSAGVFEKGYRQLIQFARKRGHISLAEGFIDGTFIPAKKGNEIGLTKRGKGSKIMAICDANGLLVALAVASANPHESRLVDTVIRSAPLNDLPRTIIGDRAYDADDLDRQIARDHGIRMVAPNKRNRINNPEDGRRLRRYRRRWHIERCFAWLHNYRRVVIRWERRAANWLGFIWLAAGNLLANRVMR